MVSGETELFENKLDFKMDCFFFQGWGLVGTLKPQSPKHRNSLEDLHYFPRGKRNTLTMDRIPTGQDRVIVLFKVE